MRSLIVGGAHDGEWHDADVRRGNLQVPVRTRMPLMPFSEEMVPECVPIRVETYTPRRWRCGPEEWFIWAPPSMSEVEVMDLLLAGYRRP